ncbi:predicted Na+-dependent transporter [Solibacillus silvestris StLB046]|uniref:Predicted Na+-dependent transporter n=1 Tax=Solibacillus silvestris (strain StLB046) TaxID=1002809 RepID=F2F135_SOLSS|nr:bile acid:sodium symporter family protein [Solibacillus silvestris]BAK16830.1 predicted Na+-dependent transporter [Solibacillus silvestris StLB046]
MGIDTIQINFNETALLIMNIVIGFIMFGVALDLQVSDFKRSLKTPKPALIGLACQFFLLPAITFVLVSIIQPIPSIALGLFLVAACPGGNLSNFLTHYAKGNTPLSISMSAISTVLAIVMTPLNTMFWASLYGPTKEIITSFSISVVDMFTTIFFMLGLPLIIGMYIRKVYPKFAARFNQIMMKLSIVIFILFVVIMVANNFDAFITNVGAVIWVVILQNLLAICIGYFSSRALKVNERDRRAIAIEVGIQNSGLGLVLIFNFFGGLGGMALVAAFWGIWHIISGLAIATFWSRRAPEAIVTVQQEVQA